MFLCIYFPLESRQNLPAPWQAKLAGLEQNAGRLVQSYGEKYISEDRSFRCRLLRVFESRPWVVGIEHSQGPVLR